MKNTQKEPMVKHSSQVHVTTDYFLFKPIEGNRNKNLLHINRLKKSISDNYLFTVIIVNDNYEIIDGQHRFEVIQELKLPLYYVVCKNYGLNEVQILNQNSKTWNSDDYMEGYCKLGYREYLKYKEFKELYDFGHSECQMLLTGVQQGSGKRASNATTFFSGQFKINNYNNACSISDKILLISPYYEGIKRKSFILAMVQLLKNPKFEFTEFLQKLKSQPTALMDCTNNSQYISLIEEIYNYRRRDKVNLRY
jgi:hypothetical protein